MTVVIKLLTFPLTKSQLESTNKMQALQPTIKGLQAKYQSNPEVMNQKIAEVYQTNDVNPLAGCIPSLVQIPVFIGLYRSLSNLAQEGLLEKEGFFWIPSLSAPTSIAARQAGSGTAWLLPLDESGAPPIGWEAAAPYLVLPVLLVIAQYVSTD